jgi:hypothetical protein
MRKDSLVKENSRSMARRRCRMLCDLGEDISLLAFE